MEGAAGGEKSKGKENEEKLKTDDGLKTKEKDKVNLREKVNFIARNREAAAAGGGRGQQGKIQLRPNDIARQSRAESSNMECH